MGLDFVELIIATEETFNVHIEDLQAERLRTVGDLYELVLSKIDVAQGGSHCLTSAAFYRTRRALSEALGRERRLIRPQTPLAELFPEEQRRMAWTAFEARMELAIPKFSRLPWTSRFPAEMVTVGDLANEVLAKNYGFLLAEVGIPTRADVWRALVDLIVRQLGVKPQQVRPEAHFIEDLRVD